MSRLEVIFLFAAGVTGFFLIARRRLSWIPQERFLLIEDFLTAVEGHPAGVAVRALLGLGATYLGRSYVILGRKSHLLYFFAIRKTLAVLLPEKLGHSQGPIFAALTPLAGGGLLVSRPPLPEEWTLPADWRFLMDTGSDPVRFVKHHLWELKERETSPNGSGILSRERALELWEQSWFQFWEAQRQGDAYRERRGGLLEARWPWVFFRIFPKRNGHLQQIGWWGALAAGAAVLTFFRMGEGALAALLPGFLTPWLSLESWTFVLETLLAGLVGVYAGPFVTKGSWVGAFFLTAPQMLIAPPPGLCWVLCVWGMAGCGLSAGQKLKRMLLPVAVNR